MSTGLLFLPAALAAWPAGSEDPGRNVGSAPVREKADIGVQVRAVVEFTEEATLFEIYFQATEETPFGTRPNVDATVSWMLRDPYTGLGIGPWNNTETDGGRFDLRIPYRPDQVGTTQCLSILFKVQDGDVVELSSFEVWYLVGVD